MLRVQSLPFEHPVRIRLTQLVDRYPERDRLLPQSALWGASGARLVLVRVGRPPC